MTLIIYKIYLTNFSSGGQASCAATSISGEDETAPPKYFFWKKNATFTSPIITGTSTSGPITAANAAPAVDAEDRHRHSNRQFKVVAGSSE